MSHHYIICSCEGNKSLFTEIILLLLIMDINVIATIQLFFLHYEKVFFYNIVSSGFLLGAMSSLSSRKFVALQSSLCALESLLIYRPTSLTSPPLVHLGSFSVGAGFYLATNMFPNQQCQCTVGQLTVF